MQICVVLFCFHAKVIQAAFAGFPYAQVLANGKYDAAVAFGCCYIMILNSKGLKNPFLGFTIL